MQGCFALLPAATSKNLVIFKQHISTLVTFPATLTQVLSCLKSVSAGLTSGLRNCDEKKTPRATNKVTARRVLPIISKLQRSRGLETVRASSLSAFIYIHIVMYYCYYHYAYYIYIYMMYVYVCVHIYIHIHTLIIIIVIVIV